METSFFSALVVLFGLCAGSFLHTCIQRISKGGLINLDRSRCDSCGVILAWPELIPVWSSLWCKGRCRHCGAAITYSNLWVELAAAALALATLWAKGPTPAFLWMFGTGCALLAIAWVDMEHGIIPDAFVTVGVAIVLAEAGWVGGAAIQRTLIGMIVGAGSFAVLRLLYRTVRGREGMGMGDVKLAGLLGAALGPGAFSFVVIVGSGLGSAVGFWLVLRGRARWETPLPFGFFLALAGIVLLIFRTIPRF